MRKILVFPLLLLLFIAVACDPAPKGYVYNKEYQPAYWSYLPIVAGKSIFIDPVYHEAIYSLDLTSCSTLQTDGQCQTNQIEVTRDEYNKWKIGEYWNGDN